MVIIFMAPPTSKGTVLTTSPITSMVIGMKAMSATTAGDDQALVERGHDVLVARARFHEPGADDRGR